MTCPKSVMIIAEAGVNHNGRLELAKRLVEAAKEAGADAVKFQAFVPEEVASHAAEKADYQKENVGSEGSQVEMLRELALSGAEFAELRSYCDREGITFLCTPFDLASVDMLDQLDVPMFKIGSGDIVSYPFLEYVASKGRPILLSTGMATLGEVEKAIHTVAKAGTVPLTLLHCTSAYPTPYTDVNLQAMVTMREAFGLPVGYSDHTEGTHVAAAAVALGACVIEKHFTLDRKMSGPDHKASLEPDELRHLVKVVRDIEAALGDGVKQPSIAELNTLVAARRSLVATRDIEVGEVISARDITFKRPGTGIAPEMLGVIVGRPARRRIPEDSVITWEMV